MDTHRRLLVRLRRLAGVAVHAFAAGAATGLVLRHDGFCLWADDDQDHFGAFDPTAVSVLDGDVGAACGGSGDDEFAGCWDPGVESGGGGVVSERVFCLCGCGVF